MQFLPPRVYLPSQIQWGYNEHRKRSSILRGSKAIGQIWRSSLILGLLLPSNEFPSPYRAPCPLDVPASLREVAPVLRTGCLIAYRLPHSKAGKPRASHSSTYMHLTAS